MTPPLAATGVFIARGVRLGPMWFTPYGVCAALGLCLALALSRFSARWVGLDQEKVADAGLFAVVACFVASRFLLVLSDLTAFLKYPLIVLSLPSLTIGGIALAGVIVWLYLRYRKLPILSMLDAFSVPAAALAAFLETGHALDGSEPGMPLNPRWSAASTWGPGTVHLHPVAVYGVGAAVLLACLLWRVARTKGATGRTAALALMVGGGVAFALDMLTQPPAEFLNLLNLGIEPGQVVALVAVISGTCLWTYVSGQRSQVMAAPEAGHPYAAHPSMPSAEMH